MNETSFRVVVAQWSRDRDALRHVREVVFVLGQRVPVELEWDGLDPDCDHVLALDTVGQPIGTARMSADHRIGRMAVLAEWRGRGVGASMLAQLLELARARAWPEVALHAQAGAIGFYRRFGFVGEGDEFMEAGIRHRLMRRDLRRPAPAPAGEVGGTQG